MITSRFFLRALKGPAATLRLLKLSKSLDPPPGGRGRIPLLFGPRYLEGKALSTAAVPVPQSQDIIGDEGNPPPLKKKRKKRGTGFAAQNRQLIAKIMDVEEKDVRRSPGKLISEDSARELYSVLQKYGFTVSEILGHLELFMMTPWATSNYLEIMKESLFLHVGLGHISNFNTLHKKELGVLHEGKIIPEIESIFQNYLEVLEAQGMEGDVRGGLPEDISRLSLKEFRQLFIIHFLAWKFNCDKSKVEPVLEKYQRINTRCFKWIKRSADILMREGGFEVEKILKHGYLLTGNPENTLDILTSVDTLSTMPLLKLGHRRPKILMSQKSSLLDIEELFKTHGILSESIQRHPELYTLSPNTVRERLEELANIPEFQVLKNHIRVSRLIYYQKMVKERIELLKELNITGASLHLLSSNRDRFKDLISKGEIKGKGTDLLHFLKGFLNMEGVNTKEIRKNLMKQPHWLHVTVVNVRDTVKFLQDSGTFSKSQILSALPLVLYPKEKVEKAFREVEEQGEAKPQDPYFLQMVLYFLEKDVHFSGDGIWEAGTTAKEPAPYYEEPGGEGHTLKSPHEEEDIVFGDSLHETVLTTKKKNE